MVPGTSRRPRGTRLLSRSAPTALTRGTRPDPTPGPPLRSTAKTLLGLAISAAALAWVLRGEDLGEIAGHIARADYVLLLLAVIVGTSGYLVRAMRWKVLLRAVKPDTTLRSRFAATTFGFAVTNVVPLRLGEIARPVALARMENVPISGAFGSLVIERFLDLIVLTTLLLVPVFLPSFPADAANTNASLAPILAFLTKALVGLLAVLVVLLAFPAPMSRIARFTFRWLPEPLRTRAVGAVDAFVSSLAMLRDPRSLVAAVLWSFGFWIWHGISFWLAILAFGLDVPFAAAFFTEAVVGFVVALPAAPGFIGTFQVGTELALVTVYGLSAAPVLAFSFGYLISTMIPVTVIGLVYGSRMGFSLRELRRSPADVAAG